LSYWTEHNDTLKIGAFAGCVGLLQDHLSQLLSGSWFLCHSGSRCRSTHWPRRTIGKAVNCQYNRPNRKCGRLSPLRPIDLALTLHGRRIRVLDLDPSISATHAVRGPKALGHDALAVERTSILVDQAAITTIGLIDRDSGVALL
jgi:hypothetical protein